jgi:hypothetical protein
VIIQGKVHSVESYPSGTAVVADYAAGATVLEVGSYLDLQETGGSVTILGTEYGYTLDIATVTITLDTALDADIEDGEAVLLVPAATEKRAYVYTDDEQDAIIAVIPHALQSNLEEGAREENERETVTVEEIRGAWYVQNVIGLESLEGIEVDTGQGIFTTLIVDGVDSDADDIPDSGFTVYGTEFLAWLDALPRGIVAKGQRGSDSSTTTTTEQPYLQVDFEAQPGRQYKVCWTISTYNDTASGRDIVRIRYTTNGTAPTTSSTELRGMRLNHPPVTNTSAHGVGSKIFSVVTPTDYRFLMTYRAETGTVNMNASSDNQIELWVEDIGPALTDTGIDRTGGSPPATLKSYVTTWVSTDARCYMGNGSQDSSQGSEDMKQGYSSYDGDSRSLWIFPSMTGALSGATISRIRVYLYANHWYNNAGGTARVKVHGYGSAPASSPSFQTALDSANWKPGGRWVTLPSSLHAGFIAGTWRGVAVGPANSKNLVYYGRFNRSGSTNAKIEISYKK